MRQSGSGSRAARWLPLALIAVGLALPARAADDSTHDLAGDIKARSADNKYGIQTMCLDSSGNVLALVAPPRGYGAAVKDATSEVHVFTAEGKAKANWKVPFHAHAINVGPDGKVYVGGDGQLARFDATGKQLDLVALPHIKAAVEDPTARKKAEDQLKQRKDAFENNVKRIKDLKEKLEAKKEADRTEQDKRLITSYDSILKNYAQNAQAYTGGTVEDVLAQNMARLKIINGLAVSAKDVFVVCGEAAGFGYAVWRLDDKLANPKQVMSGLSGCCGQMDIQVAGTDLLVAENTKHRFARYDRDGKAIGAWGTRGKETDPGCFGGCCNPMNLRAASNGDIFTAESEGIIKRFTEKGDFLAIVGFVKLTGGCKNVAVAANATGERVYFCDQPGSRIIILAKKKDAPKKGE